jgi:uncharacterized membrane protein YqiK
VIVGVAVAAILAFVIVFWKAGVVGAAQKAITTASYAGKVMSNKALDDDTKEKEIQKSAISLLGSVFHCLAQRRIVGGHCRADLWSRSGWIG